MAVGGFDYFNRYADMRKVLGSHNNIIRANDVINSAKIELLLFTLTMRK